MTLTPEARSRLIDRMESTVKLLPGGGAMMANRGQREVVARLLEDGAAELRRGFDPGHEVAA